MRIEIAIQLWKLFIKCPICRFKLFGAASKQLEGLSCLIISRLICLLLLDLRFLVPLFYPTPCNITLIIYMHILSVCDIRESFPEKLQAAECKAIRATNRVYSIRSYWDGGTACTLSQSRDNDS